MKKIASLVLTAVLLAAMLTVFAVPAFAEETKTADDYLKEAEALISMKKYNEAADAYCQAGEMFRRAGDSSSAAEAYKKSIELYTEVIHACLETVKLKKEAGDSDAAAAAYLEACKAYERVAISYGHVGDFASAADAYMKAAACCIKAGDWAYAGFSYEAAARVYWTELYDYVSAGDTFMKAGACFMKADMWSSACGNFSGAVSAYGEVGVLPNADAAKQQTETGAENESDLENSDTEVSYLLKDYYKAMAHVGEASAYRKAGNKNDADNAIDDLYGIFSWGSFNGYQGNEGGSFDSPSVSSLSNFFGSTLSEGSLTIICTLAAAVVFGFGGFFIGRKKKKPAVAGGAESDE